MIRAYLTPDLASFQTRVSIVQHGSDGAPSRILRITGGGQDAPASYSWEEIDPSITVTPTFNLDDLVARALLDGLADHFAGADDLRALRRDYDHERARVDKLTDSLTTIARTLASVDP
ncbi:hypothetical protein [Actinoallomurus sp. NPDC052274]|uniref:hypothetical protein n=1 Tax=Actinoallomurus sp. NPDC052274 TaxID=3155420 RepID=UPI003418C331